MIRQEIWNALAEALRQEGAGALERVSLERPEHAEHGDYATNAALVLAKELGGSPKETAERLRKSIKSPGVAKIEIAGPGFLNFFVDPEVFRRELKRIAKGEYGQNREKKTIIVEYSSPNIAKRFGIGHLRSTIIGQAIYNLHEFLGYTGVGINHLGDWGTPHGIVLFQIKTHVLGDKTGKEAKEALEQLTVEQMESLYVQFGKEAEETPQVRELAREWFKKLEEGDREARMIWEFTRKKSLEEFEHMYRRLAVQIPVIGESFYEDKMAPVVRELEQNGLSRRSEGAVIVEFDALPPAMLLKSDGTTTYFTRDLAAMKYRVQKWKPDTLVIETGSEQKLHFEQVFETSRKAGWAEGVELVHVGHGMYRLPEGKFSTRKGRTIHLKEVLDEAVERAEALMKESDQLPEEERREIAEMVGIGAVKYNDLMHNPQGDVVFTWDKVLNLKGNSGPYIQYTHARCNSILRKSGDAEPERSYAEYSLQELALMRSLHAFPEVAEEAARSYAPNLLCNFAFAVAQAYNTFYHTHRVLQAESEEAKHFRLLLTEATARVLRESLRLLGIRAPERM